MKLSMSSSSRSVLREQALAASHFQVADASCVFQASQPDMEIVFRTLERELNSRPDDGAMIGTLNDKIAGSSTSNVASSSTSSCDPGSPSQASIEEKACGSLEVSNSMVGQSETPRIRTRPVKAFSRSCNSQRFIPRMNNFRGKKRSQRGNRAPQTIMRVDPANFQAIVQQMTGFPHENSSRAASSILKPHPKRPEARPSLFKPQAKQPGQIGAISSSRLLRAWGSPLP